MNVTTNNVLERFLLEEKGITNFITYALVQKKHPRTYKFISNYFLSNHYLVLGTRQGQDKVVLALSMLG